MMIYTPLLRVVCAFSIFAGVLASVNVTSPNSSTVLSAGVVSRVTWVDDGKAPSLKDFGLATISLCVGNSQNQTVLQVLASKIDVSQKSSAEFTVDAKVGPNSNLYLIRFQSADLKNVAFSQNFQLTHMTGMFTTSPTSTPASGSKSSTTTSKSSSTTSSTSVLSTTTGTDTLTAPPPIFTGTGIIGNSTDGLNSTIPVSDGNATVTPAPCPGCVNITVVVLVTTAHDSPAPSPTRSDALSITRSWSLGRLGAFAAVLVLPFTLLA